MKHFRKILSVFVMMVVMIIAMSSSTAAHASENPCAPFACTFDGGGSGYGTSGSADFGTIGSSGEKTIVISVSDTPFYGGTVSVRVSAPDSATTIDMLGTNQDYQSAWYQSYSQISLNNVSQYGTYYPVRTITVHVTGPVGANITAAYFYNPWY